ncbi:S1 RNA-binding domain-containing protein, partial [Erysipelothrix rhusiopathiae]|nr:S1 RNA-binding domain-containing protein [Erysipelothrix rhusiopathiae]
KKERSILDAERQVEKIKKAQFMSNKIGEEYVGFISGISNFGIFVELPNTVEGLIHVRNLNDDFYTFDGPSQKMIGERTGRTYSIGQKLKVKLVSVDDLEHVVNFEIIGQKKMSRRKPDSRKDGFKSKDRPSESRNTDKRKGRRINDRRRKKS